MQDITAYSASGFALKQRVAVALYIVGRVVHAPELLALSGTLRCPRLGAETPYTGPRLGVGSGLHSVIVAEVPIDGRTWILLCKFCPSLRTIFVAGAWTCVLFDVSNAARACCVLCQRAELRAAIPASVRPVVALSANCHDAISGSGVGLAEVDCVSRRCLGRPCGGFAPDFAPLLPPAVPSSFFQGRIFGFAVPS